MRVAYVCLDPGIPVFGTKGASVHIQAMVRELLKLGHQVEIHACRIGDAVPGDLTDVPVQVVPVVGTDPAQREAAQVEASQIVAHRLMENPPDLVYERYSLFSTVLAQVNSVTGCPGVLEVNSPLITEQLDHRTLVDVAGAHVALRTQVDAAASVVCVSDQVSDWVRGVTGCTRVHTISNGVDPARFFPHPEDPSTAVVTFIGTLKPWHGVHDLVRAAACARTDWQLRIIGDGPCRAELQELADGLGIDADFRGAVAPWEVPGHLAGSAVAVAPYPDLGGEQNQYFSPLKVFEYLAAGLPVVGTRVGQLPELLDGVGLLVNPSDPSGLAAAIDELVLDPGRRARMGEQARSRAVQEHGWDRVAARILGTVGVSDGAQE